MNAICSLVLFAALAAGNDAAIVEFASPNCPACRAMAPVVRRLAEEGISVEQVNGQQQPDLVRRFRISSYPTYVLMVGGKEVDRIVGAASHDRLLQLWEKAGNAPSGSRASIGASRPVGGTPSKQDIVRGQSPDGRFATRTQASPEQIALAATVRLKVDDASGQGVGTGTIIDTHYNEEAKASEALIVTCGHLFRESQGKGKITVELFTGGGAQAVDGTLLDYNLEQDIALVTIWPGVEVTPVHVAPKGFISRPQDRVFSIGCSKGQDPTIENSRVNAINRFQGRPNITAAGMPVDGRSGGGLFSAEGMLIGVCNAANPSDNEGLYAALATIQWQLDKFNLQEIYDRTVLAAEPPPAEAAVAATAPANFEQAVQPRALLPELPAQMPTRSAVPENRLPALAEATASSDDETEVVCIVRSKKNPEIQSEIYVVDNVSSELLQRITTAARASAQARAAARGFAPVSPDRLAQQPRPREQPVVRGQLR